MKKSPLYSESKSPRMPPPNTDVTGPLSPARLPPARCESDVFARVEKILSIPSDDNVAFALNKLGALRTPAAREIEAVLRKQRGRSDATPKRKREFYDAIDTALAMLRQA